MIFVAYCKSGVSVLPGNMIHMKPYEAIYKQTLQHHNILLSHIYSDCFCPLTSDFSMKNNVIMQEYTYEPEALHSFYYKT